MLDRRGFLRFVGLGAAAAVAAPYVPKTVQHGFSSDDQIVITGVRGFTPLPPEEWIFTYRYPTDILSANLIRVIPPAQ